MITSRRSFVHDDHSLGTKIHSSRYRSRPAPAKMNNTVKISLQTQDSAPVDRAIPPQTPPSTRSLRLRRKELTAATTGSSARPPCAFNSRAFASANSSSVNAPLARSSASLLSSSLMVIAISLKGQALARILMLASADTQEHG